MIANTIGKLIGTVLGIILLPVIMVIGAAASIVAVVRAIVIMWSKPAPAVKPSTPAKNDTVPAPMASDPNITNDPEWGDVDFAKVALCDPTKIGHG